jgi:hypothetical protein
LFNPNGVVSGARWCQTPVLKSQIGVHEPHIRSRRGDVPVPQSLAQIYLHIVFSTKERRPLLDDPTVRDEMHRILGAECNKLDCPVLCVGGVGWGAIHRSRPGVAHLRRATPGFDMKPRWGLFSPGERLRKLRRAIQLRTRGEVETLGARSVNPMPQNGRPRQAHTMSNSRDYNQPAKRLARTRRRLRYNCAGPNTGGFLG